MPYEDRMEGIDKEQINLRAHTAHLLTCTDMELYTKYKSQERPGKAAEAAAAEESRSWDERGLENSVW